MDDFGTIRQRRGSIFRDLGMNFSCPAKVSGCGGFRFVLASLTLHPRFFEDKLLGIECGISFAVLRAVLIIPW